MKYFSWKTVVISTGDLYSVFQVKHRKKQKTATIKKWENAV